MNEQMHGLVKPCTQYNFLNNIMNKPIENNNPLLKIANSALVDLPTLPRGPHHPTSLLAAVPGNSRLTQLTKGGGALR
jgi:hypothetical protein